MALKRFYFVFEFFLDILQSFLQLRPATAVVAVLQALRIQIF